MGTGAAPLRPASGPAGGAGPRRGGRAASPAVPSAEQRRGRLRGRRTHRPEGARRRPTWPGSRSPGGERGEQQGGRGRSVAAAGEAGHRESARAARRGGDDDHGLGAAAASTRALGRAPGKLTPPCSRAVREPVGLAWLPWLSHPAARAARSRPRSEPGAAGWSGRDPGCHLTARSALRGCPPWRGVELASIARQQRIPSFSRAPGSGPLRGAFSRVPWVPRSATAVGGGHGAVAVVSDGSSRLREGPGRGRGGSARHEAREPELDTRAIPTLSLRGPQPARLGG